ncbi:MAG: superoxide dismutase family protein [Wenzhouxiangellaceae bacterium]
MNGSSTTWRNALATLCALTLIGPAWAHEAKGRFVNAQGDAVGTVVLVQGPAGVLARVEVDGLPPGPKAIHIHHTGTCEDHSHGFKASGGHVDPDQRAHGLLNPEGPEAGDFPNLYVHEDGHAWAEFYNERISLDGSTGVNLLDEDGAAFVIHEGPDDHRTQPIGGAGARIACAVVHLRD